METNSHLVFSASLSSLSQATGPVSADLGGCTKRGYNCARMVWIPLFLLKKLLFLLSLFIWFWKPARTERFCIQGRLPNPNQHKAMLFEPHPLSWWGKASSTMRVNPGSKKKPSPAFTLHDLQLRLSLVWNKSRGERKNTCVLKQTARTSLMRVFKLLLESAWLQTLSEPRGACDVWFSST